MKEYLYDIYIYYFEKKNLQNNRTNINELWNKIKKNINLLEYSSNVLKNKFRSNIIVYYILKDKEMYNTEVYNKIIQYVYSNQKIARINASYKCYDTLLYASLENDSLNLDHDKKEFLLLEALNCPFTKKYYDNIKKDIINIHGLGIFDIRYKILLNHNFSLQEKKNFILLFYPDDELKITILENIEDIVSHKLRTNYCNIYSIEENELPKEINDLIHLCKYIKGSMQEGVIKRHINND